MLPLYENIKKYRKEHRWTQEELAAKVGYTHRSSIGKIEKGEVDISQSKIKAFADVFGVTPQQLMGYDQDDVIIQVQTKPSKTDTITDKLDLLTEEQYEVVMSMIDVFIEKNKKRE